MSKINKIIIVHVGDVLRCPPALNVIKLADNLGLHVSLVTTKDHESSEYLKSMPDGVRLEVVDAPYSAKKSLVAKAAGIGKTKRMLLQAIDREYSEDNSIVWVVSDVSLKHLGNSLLSYRYVLHLMELSEELYYSKRVKSFKLDAEKLSNCASAVVVPNESRAYITQAWWGIDRLPAVLPNKPVDASKISKNAFVSDPKCKEILETVGERKIILYQGIAHKERPLLPFFQAVKSLGESYVFATMGEVDPLPQIEDSQYIHFPFVQPPGHLEITSHARIGVLSYFPVKAQYSILNAVFCAPNKSFEYSRFGIPMLSNSNFELNQMFERYSCGISVKSFDPDAIAAAISAIDGDYGHYSAGAAAYYSSVDMEKEFNSILDNIELLES